MVINMNKITVEGITVHIERKNIKNMYLKVKAPKGDVFISAPSFMQDEEIINFVLLKKDWILKKQENILNCQIRAPLKYIDGEKHYLWGEEYEISLENDVKIDYENKIIYLPKNTTPSQREQILVEIYRYELKNYLPVILEDCISLVKKRPKSITVRKMKNWGNCKKDGRITLNLYLAKKDKICVKYVLIHELCHLIEFNHSKNFKMLMDKFCPNWRQIKKRLNEKD